MRIILTYWIVALLATMGIPGFAQNSGCPISLVGLRFLMEKNLNQRLSSILSEHYPANHFLINTTIELESLGSKQRPVKVTPVFMEKLDTETETGLIQFLPEFWNRSFSKIQRITVYFLHDTSISKTHEPEIQKLIIQSVNLDLTRGDMITFEQVNPSHIRFTREAPVPHLVHAGAGINVSQLKPYLPIFTGLLFSMFLGLLIFKKKTDQNNQKQHRKNKRPEKTATEAIIKNFEFPASTTPIPQLLEEYPTQTEKIMQHWIALSPIAGLQNCAIFLKHLPISHQQTLLQYLPEETRQLVQKAAKSINGQNDAAAGRVLRDFRSDFQRFCNIAQNPVRFETLFHFLNRQSLHQINILLQKFDDGYKAIILAHLPAEKAVQHLKKMPDQIQKAILSMLGRLDKISPAFFEQLAKSLSKQVKTLILANPVIIDGVIALKSILNAADHDFRNELVNYIQNYDPGLNIKLEQAPQMFGTPPDSAGSVTGIPARDGTQAETKDLQRTINDFPEKIIPE